jgi:site-specific recombinase XerD
VDKRWDWQRFFLEWREQQTKQHENVISKLDNQHQAVVTKLDQRAQKAEYHEKAANEKYQSIYEKYLEIEKQLNFVHEQAQAEKQEQQLKDLSKAKRKQAKKQDLRQTVTRQEYRTILQQCIKGRNQFIKARRFTAIAVLYLTGLRVSNLLLINVGQLNQLLEKGHTEVALIKRGSRRHPVRLAYKGTMLLADMAEHINLLSEGKDHEKPAFTLKKGEEAPIAKHTFERELNAVLKQASSLFRKHIRTHSFRATMISDLLQNEVPVQKVQQVVGHQSIGATLAYNRNNLTVKEIDKMMTKRHQLDSHQLDSLDEENTTEGSIKLNVIKPSLMLIDP